MSTLTSGKGLPAALVAGVILVLAACTPVAPAPGTAVAAASAAVATPTAAFGTAPLVDQGGRTWQPRINRTYVSAMGTSCATVTLSPVGAGLPVQRVACLKDGKWDFVVPLSLSPGEPDPRFAPIPEQLADATGATRPSQWSTL